MTQESVYYFMHGVDGWQVVPQEEYDPERIYHVRPRGEEWVVEKEWAARPSSVHERKKGAVERGKELARTHDSILVVHKRDGEVQNRFDYRDEPAAA